VNDSTDNLDFIVIAKKEIKNSLQDEKLWRKAIALTAGDKNKAEEKYIKLRTLHLKKGKEAIPSTEKIIIPEKKQDKNENTIKLDNKESSSGNILIYIIVGVGILISIIMFIMSNKVVNTSAKKVFVEQKEAIFNDGKYSLKVNVFPATAKVSILNIKPKYYNNIRLAPGKFHIKVSSDGYISQSLWISLDGDIIKEIRLNRIGNKFSLDISSSPSGAIIKILNIKPRYHKGILLKKGKYHLSVSKKGFDTKKQWIDLDKDSNIHIALDKAAFTSEILSYDELKWCMREQTKLESLKRELDTLSFTLDRYSQSAINRYNKKVNNSNKRNDLWNKRCKNKQYKQSDYNQLNSY